MRFLLALTVASFSACSAARADSPPDSALAGFWFCHTVDGHEAYRARRSVLLVRSTDFVMITGTGVAQNTFTTDRDQIDIMRYDGDPQPGVYSIDGTTLYLSLGEISGDRPDHIGYKVSHDSKFVPHSHFRFTRLPTAEGLAVLRSALNDDINRDIIGPTVSDTSRTQAGE